MKLILYLMRFSDDFLEKMKQFILFLAFIFGVMVVYAQQDSIRIQAHLSEDLKVLSVKQSIVYKNPLSTPLQKIKLLNWVAAYRNQNTPLAKRKLEDRKKELYFAKQEELGFLNNLKINHENANFDLNSENIDVPLNEPLPPDEHLALQLEYEIQLPNINLTGYGASKDKAVLKYFFIVPDAFENEKQTPKHFLDIEETQNGGSHWDVTLTVPPSYFVEGNLEREAQSFKGVLTTDPEFLVSKTPIHLFKQGEHTIVLGYKVSEDEASYLEFFLPLQLKFLEERMGFVPKKIFISEKFSQKEDFFGNEDIKLWKFKFQLFSDAQKVDMNYFSILSKYAVHHATITDKEKEHWFTNGIKTYLEMQYLHRFYKDEMLLGKLPETKILGIKPLKYLNVSKLKLSERYGITYQYIKAMNLDQNVGAPFSTLSNFNDMAISHFETGSLLDYLAQKMTYDKFNVFLKDYLTTHQGKRVNPEAFLSRLNRATEYSADFLEPYFNRNQRFNFNLKKFKKVDDGYLVTITKNTHFSIPIKIDTEHHNGQRTTFWYDTSERKKRSEYLIPLQDLNKIQLNNGYIFPEANYRDNYLYTKGFFSNMKKVKLKLLKDIPNPEYNEIYVAPKVTFNAYDKVLLGLNFQNQSLLEENFVYSFTPFYSTGTSKFTGSAGLAYNYRPLNRFYRNLQLGGSAAYFHYDHGLAYQKYSLSSSLIFAKPLRSEENQWISLSYNYFEKDLTPTMVLNNEYDRYNLWNLGYAYSNRKLIHEMLFSTNFQLMKDFQKVSAEGFYRWEYANDKKIGFRIFGGYFLSNHARNDLFSFGISRISNYAFAYNLLGQSATSGFLSQQFVLAEGGFKSFFPHTANQWIASANIDAHLWKMFNIYADFGAYKRKGLSPQWIWDSGVKLKIVPDFLEVYFPLQSSLGFEPSFKDYSSRIRYTLIINLGAITSHFRRGWF